MYESPKTIRHRQQAQNDKPRRFPRLPREIALSSNQEWNSVCNFHVARIENLIAENNSGAAGRHAQALVHMALTRRAYWFMHEYRRAYWNAMAMARHEIYNCELEGD